MGRPPVLHRGPRLTPPQRRASGRPAAPTAVALRSSPFGLFASLCAWSGGGVATAGSTEPPSLLADPARPAGRDTMAVHRRDETPRLFLGPGSPRPGLEPLTVPCWNVPVPVHVQWAAWCAAQPDAQGNGASCPEAKEPEATGGVLDDTHAGAAQFNPGATNSLGETDVLPRPPPADRLSADAAKRIIAALTHRQRLAIALTRGGALRNIAFAHRGAGNPARGDRQGHGWRPGRQDRHCARPPGRRQTGSAGLPL